jgi:hypothetical protein
MTAIALAFLERVGHRHQLDLFLFALSAKTDLFGVQQSQLAPEDGQHISNNIPDGSDGSAVDDIVVIAVGLSQHKDHDHHLKADQRVL